MSESLGSMEPILYSFAIGGVGGFFVGYVLKKSLGAISKLAMLLGAFAFGLLYLAEMRAVDINPEHVVGLVSRAQSSLSQSVTSLTPGIPFLAGVLVGFLIGLKKG